MQKLIWISFIGWLLLNSCKEKTKQTTTETNYPETIAISEKFEDNPKDASLYFKRGNIYLQLTEDSLALNDFKKAVSLDSSKAEYYSAIGDLLFENKDITGSVTWIEKAIQLNPDDVKAHLKIAKLFLFTEEYPKAFSEINTVLRANVYNAEAYFLKGMCYKNLKDTNKALSSFQTAIHTDPKFVEAYMQMALIYDAQKNSLALDYFENAYKADSSDIEPLYGKAMFWQKQEKFAEAKKIFKRLIDLDKQYPKSYYNMGWMLLQEDSIEKAIRQFDIAIEVKPDYADAYFNRGICYEILNNNKAAEHDYNQALNFNADNEKYKAALARLTK